MEVLRNLGTQWTRERGFTLPEVLITIAILGILVGIAVPTWQNVVKSRSVDSAANQLVSDLRLTASKSTNQLTEWEILFSDASSYQIQKTGGGTPIPRTLPDDTEILAGSEVSVGDSVTFKTNGQTTAPDSDSDGETEILVGFVGGDPKTISVNLATSKAEIV